MGLFVTETKVWLYLRLTMCPLIPLWTPGISTATLTLLIPLIFCSLHQSGAVVLLRSHLGDLQSHIWLKEFSAMALPSSFLPTGEMALKGWAPHAVNSWHHHSANIIVGKLARIFFYFLFFTPFPMWRKGKRDRFVLCNVFSLEKKIIWFTWFNLVT